MHIIPAYIKYIRAIYYVLSINTRVFFSIFKCFFLENSKQFLNNAE